MPAYNSIHDGATIDPAITAYNNSLAGGGWITSTALNNTLNNYVTLINLNNILSDYVLDNTFNAATKQIYAAAYYSGSGDTQFTGWIPFNTIIENIGGGTWSSGRYYPPEEGIYVVSFTCYSNQQGEGRTAICHYDSSGSILEDQTMHNSNYSTSICAIFHANVGDYFVAGSYTSSYPIRIYAAAGHNRFTIAKIR